MKGVKYAAMVSSHFGKAESVGKNPPKDQSLAIFRKLPNSSLRINIQDSICMLGWRVSLQQCAFTEEKPSNKNTATSAVIGGGIITLIYNPTT